MSWALLFPESRLRWGLFSVFFGLGAGVVTVVIFLLSLFSIDFTVGIWLVFCILLFSLIMLKKRCVQIRQFLIDTFKRLNKKISKKTIVVLIIFFIFIFPQILKIQAGVPFLGWDAWSHWGFKAKLFFIEERVPLELYNEKISIVPLREYPLFINLIQTLFFIFIGRFDDSMVKIVFFAFYVVFVLYFYEFLRIRQKNLFNSAIFTIFFSTLPMLTRFATGYYFGYADMIYTFFNFVSITLLWLSYSKGCEKGLFFISGIFTGLALWTKCEGIILLLANLLCIGLFNLIGRFRWRFHQICLYLLFVFVSSGIWYWVVFFFRVPAVHFDIKTDLNLLSEGLVRGYILFYYFFKNILEFNNWNIFWLSFILCLPYGLIRLCLKGKDMLFINFLFQLILYFFVIILDRDFNRALINSLPRLIFQLTPIMMFLLSIQFDLFLPMRNKQK